MLVGEGATGHIQDQRDALDGASEQTEKVGGRMSKPDRKPLTEWSSPNEVIKSGWGTITYEKWCQREMERINLKAAGGAVRIVARGNQIALARVG